MGSVVDDVEYYRGIPFAAAPTGSLRLRPPIRAEKFGTFHATGTGPSCPQMTAIDDTPLVVKAQTIPQVVDSLSLLLSVPDETEDCLTINVMRPKGIMTNASLPVLFWIFGGGFEIGSPAGYNGSVLIPRSVEQGRPLILVAVNYRLGGFGFLPGAEVLADGAANLGLLDQRMALEWVADNIEAFGGDPDRVTLWGQSAGAFSVFDQMALYDGNHTYKGRPLFRAGIMNSGSILPTEAVDSTRAQAIFDTVVEAANCSSAATAEKLECLRSLDYETYWNATNSVPAPFSDHSPVGSYVARPDCRVLTASSEVLASNGLFAPVPIIIGNQEDEGSFLSLTHDNLSTNHEVESFLQEIVFQNATPDQLRAYIGTYPYQNGSAGSPFRTGTGNQEYPVYKRLSAILGDSTFTLLRRIFLDLAPPTLQAWSYLATYEYGTSFMGTFHTADLPRIFYGSDDASLAMQARYIAFVDTLDPNDGVVDAPTGFQTHWPRWYDGRELIAFGAKSTGIVCDDFRNESYDSLRANLSSFRV